MANILKGYRGNKTPLFQEVAGLVSNEDFEKITNPESNTSTPTSLGEAWARKQESKIDPTTVIDRSKSGEVRTYDPRLAHGERITIDTPETVTISDEDAAEMKRIKRYAKRHKVKGSIYEKEGRAGTGVLGLGLFPKHNTQNMKADARHSRRELAKSQRISARATRKENRQEFFRNVGTGDNIANFRQRKKSGTTKSQKDGSGNQTGEGGCLAGQCTPG
tara:strand:+ start:1047 stop:1703 length:657 start_codon:yes stop_codon:yes gene_type:complete